MTVKDRNFTLDRQRVEAVQALVAKAATSSAANTENSSINKREPLTAPIEEQAVDKPARNRSVGWAVIWPMLNTAALVALAAYLYLQHTAPAEPVVPRLTIEQVEDRLKPLTTQLAALQEALQVQQASTLSLSGQLKAMQLPKPNTEDKVQAALPAPVANPVWVINAGSFSTNNAANSAASTLQRLGYSVDVSQGSSGLWHLRLVGFDTRDHAEDAANEIMAGSELNGLWVSKRPTS